MDNVICDKAKDCKLPCHHKTEHYRTDREPINLMHSRGCNNNPRKECWGQCEPVNTVGKELEYFWDKLDARQGKG